MSPQGTTRLTVTAHRVMVSTERLLLRGFDIVPTSP